MSKGTKIKIPPKRLDLSQYIDYELEAEKFELAPKRVAEIAAEVAKSSPPTLDFTITQTQSESALRDRLQVVYNQAVAEVAQCTQPGCEHQFSDIHDFLVHHRIHLVEGPDRKIAAAVIRDIERTLVPTVEKSMVAEGALPLEERQKLISALRERAMLPASFDPKQQH